MNSVALAVAAGDEPSGPRRTIVLFTGGDEDGAGAELLLSAYDRVTSIGQGSDAAAANVVAIGLGADAALAAVSACSKGVRRLILITPEIAADAPLASIETPTLVVVGSEDSIAAPFGRRCSDEMPSCYLMLVYAAGRDLARERPEATAALIERFLESGETFPVRTATHRLYP